MNADSLDMLSQLLTTFVRRIWDLRVVSDNRTRHIKIDGHIAKLRTRYGLPVIPRQNSVGGTIESSDRSKMRQIEFERRVRFNDLFPKPNRFRDVNFFSSRTCCQFFAD